jgi:ABC-type lipoprotein export system ATPase subunit
MIVEFIDVCSKEGLNRLSLKLELNGVIQLYDPSENLSRAILNAIVGLDEIHEGQILIDGTELGDFLQKGPQIRSFGYVFDEGIMLANLSLKENLMLPLRWLNPNLAESETVNLINSWMKTFSLDMDLTQRPVRYHAGELKMLSFVRTLMIAPKCLLIDDPYYMLNKPERDNLFKTLSKLKASYPMLIASLDDDFGQGFADSVIDLSGLMQHYSPA